MKPLERDDLKKILNVISDILNERIMMEFRISEVTEKFRILANYKYTPKEDPEKFAEKSEEGIYLLFL